MNADTNPEEALREHLNEIDRYGGKPKGRGASLFHESRGMWVSGNPYLFTGFSERAFVFYDEAQADKVLETHAGVLRGFRVHVWGAA